MKQHSTEVEQGNKLIAEFDELKIGKDKIFKYERNGHQWSLQGLKYHSSWDWQISVWSKIALAVKTLLPKLADVENEAKWYFGKLSKYEQAVFKNKPEDGQKIIIELIEWYHKNKIH